MIMEDITTQVLDALKEKTVQAQTQGRELTDKFHTLAGDVEKVHKAQVARDEPHVSVGGMLDADPFRGKGYFWGEKHKGKKGQLEGKTTRAREACEAHMQGRPNYVRVFEK